MKTFPVTLENSQEIVRMVENTLFWEKKPQTPTNQTQTSSQALIRKLSLGYQNPAVVETPVLV